MGMPRFFVPYRRARRFNTTVPPIPCPIKRARSGWGGFAGHDASSASAGSVLDGQQGTFRSLKPSTASTASIIPEAPSAWPAVRLTAVIHGKLSPKNRRRREISIPSNRGVPVACSNAQYFSAAPETGRPRIWPRSSPKTSPSGSGARKCRASFPAAPSSHSANGLAPRANAWDSDSRIKHAAPSQGFIPFRKTPSGRASEECATLRFDSIAVSTPSVGASSAATATTASSTPERTSMAAR